MTFTISLPSEAEKQLRERALAAGRAIEEYVQDMISRELAAPESLIEAAEPFARAVEATGVSDEEFSVVLNQAIEGARRERRRPA
jgi:hypothetical protein